MGARPPDESSRSGADEAPDRTKLGNRDILRLIWATYATTFPLLLVFLLGMALATWIVTELIF